MRFDQKAGLPFLKSPLPRRHLRVVLLNESLIQVFCAREKGFVIKNVDTLGDRLRTDKKSLILLSAPYVYSYVHETISLNKKDLPLADVQTLGFSRFPKENRHLESFALSHEKAITIYSHLSEKGQSIIQELKREKIRFTWKPAISYLVSNLIKYPQIYLRRFKTITVILQEEILQFSWLVEFPKITHFYNWNRSLSPLEKQLSMEKLICDSLQNESRISVMLDPHSNDSKPITELLFPSGRKNSIKSILKKTRMKSRYFSGILSPTLLAIITTFIMVSYSLFSQYNLQKLKDKREALQKEVQLLQDKTGELESLASNEQSVAMVESLLSTIEYLQYDPISITKKLNDIIPLTLWIKTVILSKNRIQLELFDYEDIDLPALVSHFTKEIGPTNLVENTREIIKGKTLKKYILIILPSGSYGTE
ncbi:hypothetical protein KJ966_24445 [bacterium]|nr:hypothetical protein [bacterium]